jgi:hypothetical protein
VKDRPCRQRYPKPTANTLPTPQPNQFMSTLVPALRAHKTVRPTADQTGTPATPLLWRTVTGIHADSSAMLGVARLYTTPWGLLK